MRQAIHFFIKVLLRNILKFFWCFPIKRKRIFLINDLGYTYGDNLKYICEYILRQGDDGYELIFALRDSEPVSTLKIVAVRPFSIKYFYLLMTSQIIITNGGGVSYIPLRKQQTVISTWHGGGPYKKSGLDVYKGLWYQKEVILNAKNISYMLCSCGYFKQFECPAMLIDASKCINSGLPRNDIFFENTEKIKSKIYSKYGINKDEKLILYAPTFRSHTGDFTSSKTEYHIDVNIDKILKACSAQFTGDWVFSLRLHPKLRGFKLDSACKNVLNFTDYPDMQELLAAADLVITDYSSLMWDFSLTFKPCFILADDIEEYATTRGFYMPIDQWPFPICHNENELLLSIKNFNKAKYVADVKKHHAMSISYEAGNASSIAFNLIKKAIS